MNNATISAEEYRASLIPAGKQRVQWTSDSFSTYINLLYPHVTVVGGQEWSGNMAKYSFLCSKHGEYEANANQILDPTKGCRCKQCKADHNSSLAGIRRAPRATTEEKSRAAELYAECQNYAEVGKQLGRAASTIQRWLDPIYSEKARKHSARWASDNLERQRANGLRYIKDFDHGKASDRAHGASRRVQKQNIPEFVFLDNAWHEVDRKTTCTVFGEVLLPAKERKAIQELYLEAQYQTETTGIEHHVDHLWPLAKGGEHLMVNLQLLPATENLSKSDTFREEDQIELCLRLFDTNE
jgi:hypothetical protein